MEKTITDTLKEATKDILTEDVLKEIETAFNASVDQKVKIHVEKALMEQDEDYSKKLEKLVEAIDTDHTAKLDKVVEALDADRAEKLKQVVYASALIQVLFFALFQEFLLDYNLFQLKFLYKLIALNLYQAL
jgi:formate dehydrogenase maturation protein FdhE